ncbi:Competence protein CoiA [Streptococcus oralis]|uniref:Competence protein CoiA n=1 Tax=Streptococcus oralis TaxID=1303 RepID=A0A139RLB3_STROR|nr:competence protein CoiA family protein [Streptococcus oralis]KXU15498.1 Competence protein CoiA [Streptococcus oralis]
MFVARDIEGNLVNTLAGSLPKQAYTCPACGNPVRLRQGKCVRSHFAHERLKDCSFAYENESPEHLGNKEALYFWGSRHNKVELERPIPAIQQIADLLLDGRVALEVQCSPLSQKLLGDRSQGYRSQGYQVIWLLGEKLWLKERLTQLQRGFLYFSQNMGFYVWELDLKKQVLRLKYLLHQDLRGKLHFQVKEFPFGQGDLLEILRRPYQTQALSQFEVSVDKEICHYIRQQLYYQNPHWMKKQALAYEKGDNLLSYEVKDWFPQVRPIEGEDFCQIEQDLLSYYQNFQAFYRNTSPNSIQKLYPPAFYDRYFLKNMVK